MKFIFFIFFFFFNKDDKINCKNYNKTIIILLIYDIDKIFSYKVINSTKFPSSGGIEPFKPL